MEIPKLPSPRRSAAMLVVSGCSLVFNFIKFQFSGSIAGAHSGTEALLLSLVSELPGFFLREPEGVSS